MTHEREPDAHRRGATSIDHGETHESGRRHGVTPLGRTVQLLVAISIVAFIVLMIGAIAEWDGFTDDKDDSTTFGDVTWATFALAGLAAFLAGIVALILGRRRNDSAGRRAAMSGLIWLPLALVITVVVNEIV